MKGSTLHGRSRFGRRAAACTAVTAIALAATAIHAAAAMEITSVSGCEDGSTGTSNCPAAGNIPLTIRGTSFGDASAASVGRNDCSLSSHTSDEVVCTLPPGTGRLVPVTVRDAFGNASPPAFLVDYAPPVITAVRGCEVGADGASTTDCARSGGNIITIQGQNFGASGAKVLVDGNDCPQGGAPASDSTIICTLPPGSGSSRSVVVAAEGGQLDSAPLLSYAPCPPGTGAAGSTCQACPPGQTSSGGHEPTCASCPAGTTIDAAGACVGTTDFTCWKTKDVGDPRFESIDDLAVSDELADGTVDVKKSSLYCTAADVGGTGVSPPDLQRCCYQVKGSKLASAATVAVQDDIGTDLTLSVQQPAMICTECAAEVQP